jgi:hypothetical protein
MSSAEVLSLTRMFEDSGSPDEFVRQVRAAIDGTLRRGGTVFVSGDAVDLEPQTLRRYGPGLAGAERIWKSYHDRWLLVEGERSRYFSIRGGAP